MVVWVLFVGGVVCNGGLAVWCLFWWFLVVLRMVGFNFGVSYGFSVVSQAYQSLFVYFPRKFLF
jgi:hypothetical protein